MPVNGENDYANAKANGLDYRNASSRHGLDYAGESPRITDRKETVHAATDAAIENADHRLNHPAASRQPEEYALPETGLDDADLTEFADFNPGLRDACESIIDYAMSLIQESAAAVTGFLEGGAPEYVVHGSDFIADAGANYQPVDAEIPHNAYTPDKAPRNDPKQAAAAGA